MSGLIVFDFDNTLVHSKIDFVGIRRELFEMLRRNGHPDAAGDELAERLTRLSIGEIIDAGTAHDRGGSTTRRGGSCWSTRRPAWSPRASSRTPARRSTACATSGFSSR